MGWTKAQGEELRHPKPSNSSWQVRKTPQAPDDACSKGTCDHAEHQQGTVIQ